MDFETLLREDPDHVIEYLANRGTKLLGTFVTEARAPAGKLACTCVIVSHAAVEVVHRRAVHCQQCCSSARGAVWLNLADFVGHLSGSVSRHTRTPLTLAVCCPGRHPLVVTCWKPLRPYAGHGGAAAAA